MIEIQNINSNKLEDIINLLLDKQEQPFEIYFPKYTLLYSSTNEDIADDYARLAYVGHRLNQSSDHINYEVVYPHDHDSVLFEVTTKSLNQLAELLLELSYLYENSDEETNEEYNYWDDVYQYIDDVECKKHIPYCSEFIEIYIEFKNKINENKE